MQYSAYTVTGQAIALILKTATRGLRHGGDWLKAVGVRTLYIEPGSPWENGYVESFNGKLRDEPRIFNLVFDIPTFQRP